MVTVTSGIITTILTIPILYGACYVVYRQQAAVYWPQFVTVVLFILVLLLLVKSGLSLSNSTANFLGMSPNASTVCEFECPPGVPQCKKNDGTIIVKDKIKGKIGIKKAPHIFELMVGILIVLVVILVLSRQKGESIIRHAWLISATTFSLMLFLLISSFTINLNMRAQYFGDFTTNNDNAFYYNEDPSTATSCLNLPSKWDTVAKEEVKSYKTDTIIISLAYVLLAGSVVVLTLLGRGEDTNVDIGDEGEADFDLDY